MVRVQENINQGQIIQTELEKALEQMKEYLAGPQMWFCIKSQDEEFKKRTRQGFYERIGINALAHWPNLLNYYQDEPEKQAIINDLKEKLEKIKNNELPDYNREMANDICDYLIGQRNLSPTPQNAERLLRP